MCMMNIPDSMQFQLHPLSWCFSIKKLRCEIHTILFGQPESQNKRLKRIRGHSGKKHPNKFSLVYTQQHPKSKITAKQHINNNDKYQPQPSLQTPQKLKLNPPNRTALNLRPDANVNEERSDTSSCISRDCISCIRAFPLVWFTDQGTMI